ncbi:terminase small subunit [Neisseria musculi]|uniref:Terminase small subunit n=1 Tax=Neisseria musculi TaxID=1815583 RepID=A0A7H1MFB4_9NEIS|nr:terminase small subunit [Neisseria musculi]QNT60329.1 terminase small subunit [Neisseria musculi]
MAMNEQKEAFAKAKVRGLSNREAAIAAGYSAKTASASGSRLAKDEDVLAEIASLKEAGYAAAPERAADGVRAHLPSASLPADEAEKAEQAESSESLDRIALAARERAIVRGTTIELDGVVYDQTDPKDQLILCQLGVLSLNRQQIEAAKSLLPYHHGKVADMGKKDAEREAARNAMGGRFGTMQPPEPMQGRLC